MHKRSRPKEEKIHDAIEKVGNIHPELAKELFAELINCNEINNSTKLIKKFITNKLKLPEQGRCTKEYWLQRGWSELDSLKKSKENYSKRKKLPSVYSREFWITKINPATNQFYTIEEADFERNSRRPIRKEYWIIRGYCEEEAITLAKNVKDDNNKKGAATDRGILKRVGSQMCVEHWIVKGYSEEEAKEIISKIDTSFSLEKCIRKYGEEKGKLFWKQRQEKWQNTLNSKSEEEKESINRRKATKMNFRTLWRKELSTPCVLYLVKIFNEYETFYKVGITTGTIKGRLGHYFRNYGYNYELIKVIEGTASSCFLAEQTIIKENRCIKYTPKIKIDGWTECFENEPFIEY